MSNFCEAVKLQQILFSQGFGTRRQCDALIDSGATLAGTDRAGAEAAA